MPAGSLLPTAWEADGEGSTQQVPVPVPSSDLSVLKWQGAGRAQVRGCSRVCALCRPPEPGEGSHKAAFISPCRARDSLCSCTQRAPFTRRARVGGPAWGQHIRSPCPAFPKELLVLPGLPVQRDYRNVSELQVSFLFPQKKTGRHSH